jgi:Spy/CpxP family protein refolding chaperone
MLGMGSLMAQTQEQIDQFNKERKEFFTKELELTDAESKAFWPLYEDFSNRKMKLAEDERNAYRYAYKNAGNLSDEDIKETLAKTFRLKEEQLALEKDFYQNRFMKVLPASKVMKLGKVEWDFRKHLMRKLRNQGDDRPGGRSSSSSRGGSSAPGVSSGPGGGSVPGSSTLPGSSTVDGSLSTESAIMRAPF